jgi:hypothetical protein
MIPGPEPGPNIRNVALSRNENDVDGVRPSSGAATVDRRTAADSRRRMLTGQHTEWCPVHHMQSGAFSLSSLLRPGTGALRNCIVPA